MGGDGLPMSLGAALHNRTFCHQGPIRAKISLHLESYGLNVSRACNLNRSGKLLLKSNSTAAFVPPLEVPAWELSKNAWFPLPV